MQTLHKGCVLCLRVADNDIIIGHEKSIGNFTLCGEGFARTGRTQNQAIGVLEPLAVHHDKVVGEGVQAIVQRFPPGLIKFLGGKGHKMAVLLVVSPR